MEIGGGIWDKPGRDWWNFSDQKAEMEVGEAVRGDIPKREKHSHIGTEQEVG